MSKEIIVANCIRRGRLGKCLVQTNVNLLNVSYYGYGTIAKARAAKMLYGVGMWKPKRKKTLT